MAFWTSSGLPQRQRRRTRHTWRGPCPTMHTQPTLLERPQRRRKRSKSRDWWTCETGRLTRVARSVTSKGPPRCGMERKARAPTPRSGSKNRGQARLKDRPSTEVGMAVGLLARPQVRLTNGTHTGDTGAQKKL
eukprot:6456695-Amphidinium_carterae.1